MKAEEEQQRRDEELKKAREEKERLEREQREKEEQEYLERKAQWDRQAEVQRGECFDFQTYTVFMPNESIGEDLQHCNEK